MHAAAKLGRDPVSKRTRFSLSMEMSRLTRDGAAEPVSRDHILRRERGQGNTFPVQLTASRIGNLTRLIHTLAIRVTIHTYEGKLRNTLQEMVQTNVKTVHQSWQFSPVIWWMSRSLIEMRSDFSLNPDRLGLLSPRPTASALSNKSDK